MRRGGVRPAPRDAIITKHDRKAPEKGQAPGAVTKGAAARFVVAQLARRRAALNPDRQVVVSVMHRSRAGRINAIGRGDDAQFLQNCGRH